MCERVIGFMDVEGYGRIDFVRHGKKETDDTDDSVHFTWRASNMVGEVTNRSTRFENPEDPINNISEIVANNGNPFKP